MPLNADQFDLTVVVPSYSSGATLHRCLEAIEMQLTTLRYRVVVMHSGTEGIPDEVIQSNPNVEFHIAPERRLPGIQRNVGARAAGTRWIAFVDSDCVVGPTWLDVLVCELTETGAVGAGAALAGEPASGVSWVMHMLEFGTWLPGHRSGDVRDLPSCDIVYDRARFLAAGGFPEDLFPCEDTALNVKLRQDGHRLRFVGEVTATHIHLRTAKEVLRHNARLGLMYGAVVDLTGQSRRLRSRAAIPLVVAARLAGVLVRTLRYRPRDFTQLIAARTLLFKCVASWARGFSTSAPHV